MPSQELSTTYADRERHNAQRYRQTDGRTDDSIMPVADYIALYDRLSQQHLSFLFTLLRNTECHSILVVA